MAIIKVGSSFLDGKLIASVNDITNALPDLANITTNGLLKVLSGVATEYMDGSGNWSTPIGTTYTADGTTLNLVGKEFSHANITRTDGSATQLTPTHGGTFEIVSGVTSNNGHITAVTTRNIKLPAATVNTDSYINTASFNTANGVLSLGRIGTSTATITVDLDDRYLLATNFTDFDTKLASLDWIDATTGPKLKATISDGSSTTVITSASIPAASQTSHGIVTTNDQTFAGNKTFSGNVVVQGVLTTKNVEVIETTNGIIFEGTANDFETTLKAVDPTKDNIVWLPNKDGTIALISDIPESDKYDYWKFSVDGVAKDNIISKGVLDFISGDGIEVTRTAAGKLSFKNTKPDIDHNTWRPISSLQEVTNVGSVTTNAITINNGTLYPLSIGSGAQSLSDGYVGIQFKGHDTQLGYIKATHVDIESKGDGLYSFHVGSTETKTNLIVDGDVYARDNKLATESFTTGYVKDSTITITAGNKLITGGSFTLNQSTNKNITLNHATSAFDMTVLTGAKVISKIEDDGYGHVDTITTRDLTLSDLGYVERAINDGKFTASTAGAGITGSGVFYANQVGDSAFTVTSNATADATVDTIVLRDTSGDIKTNNKFYYNDKAYTEYNSVDKSIDFVFN